MNDICLFILKLALLQLIVTSTSATIYLISELWYIDRLMNESLDCYRKMKIVCGVGKFCFATDINGHF